MSNVHVVFWPDLVQGGGKRNKKLLIVYVRIWNCLNNKQIANKGFAAMGFFNGNP
jgi:hypothetical protein